LGPLFKVNRLK